MNKRDTSVHQGDTGGALARMAENTYVHIHKRDTYAYVHKGDTGDTLAHMTVCSKEKKKYEEEKKISPTKEIPATHWRT
jgi:hypothetical protein